MDLEYENLNSHNNQGYYPPSYNNTPSSTSSSSSSTSSTISSFCTPSNKKSFFERITNMNNNNTNTNNISSLDQFQGNLNSNYTSTSPYINGNTSSMTSSTSQIFATAASFNISQNDTVFYSRETIHLLVKFLSNHSDNTIFRSLYSFAPDNLAWLWAFFDWDTPLNLEIVDSQETFLPLTLSDDPTGIFNEESIKIMNKIFADSPLLQYKYRDNIMIADVFKFIEHVQKLTITPVARALFSLYFPRLAVYIENPLKDLNISPKILKTNLSRIKLVDEIIKSLIRSRYSDLNEYKQKIISNINLPSYVRSLLNENQFWSPNSKLLQQLILTVNLNTNNNNNQSSKSSTSSLSSLKNSKTDKISNNINYFQFNSNVPNLSIKTTTDYLKLLHNNTRINNDLDSSFDNLTLNKQVTLAKGEEDEDLDEQDPNNELNDLTSATTSNENNDKLLEENVFNSPDLVTEHNLDITINGSSKSQLNNGAAALASYYFNTIQNQNQVTNNQLLLNGLQSPKLNINSMELLEDNSKLSVSVNNNGSHSNLQSPSALSPVPNRQAAKIMLNTPKTPSNLTQYMSSTYGSNSTLTNDQTSLWNNRIVRNMMTPPPSAASLKSNAGNGSLGAITNSINAFELDSNEINNYQNDSTLASPVQRPNNKTGFNTQFNLNPLDPLVINALNDESFTKYLKHSAFISSPVTRFNNNKFQTSDYSTIQHNKNFKLNNYFDSNNKLTLSSNNKTYSSNDYASIFNQQQQYQQQSHTSYHQQRHNSNVELNFPSNKLGANRNNYSANDVNNETFYNDTNNNNNNSSLCRSPVQSNLTMLLNQQSQAITNYFNNNGSSHQIWAGRLPPKIYTENALYSRKVFLGGLPWDVNQQSLLQSLHRYGSVKLEIPGKDAKHPRVSSMCKTQERSTPGYVYIIYDNEASVQKMLADCRKEYKNGGEHYYYSILISPNNQNSLNYQFNNKRCKSKEVEVIPWNQEDTSYVPQNKTSMLPAKIDAKSTIFVGALHGMLNAQGLAKVMNEVFGEVIHAGLDTDKYKYPIGSGRVTFRNRQSYIKAIKSRYVTIKANLDPSDPSPKFEKTIQIDPYLEDAKCCKCESKSYYFCRNENCLDYYCMNCWQYRHDTKNNGEHQSISRQNKQNYS